MRLKGGFVGLFALMTGCSFLAAAVRPASPRHDDCSLVPAFVDTAISLGAGAVAVVSEYDRGRACDTPQGCETERELTLVIVVLPAIAVHLIAAASASTGFALDARCRSRRDSRGLRRAIVE